MNRRKCVLWHMPAKRASFPGESVSRGLQGSTGVIWEARFLCSMDHPGVLAELSAVRVAPHVDLEHGRCFHANEHWLK